MPSSSHEIVKIIVTITSLLIILLLAMSCKECPTEPDYNIYLSVEDVASVQVTLKVSLPDSGEVNTFTLERNNSTIATYNCFDDDTLITDEGLTPDTDYSYTVYFQINGDTKAMSDPVLVHTQDTTSHDIIWEMTTLGNYYSSLRDVWIVNENDIWAIGDIETDSGEYNAVHWNGSEWKLQGIYSNTLNLYSIYYFSDKDMWVTDYCSPIHWDVKEWTLYNIQKIGLDACTGIDIWGTSSSNMYFVGLEGSIVHYNGSDFTKMETNTDIDLQHIYGVGEGDNVWACGRTNSGDRGILLKKSGDSWKTIVETNSSETGSSIPYDTLYLSVDGVWLSETANHLWIANGWGVYDYSIIQGKYNWVYPRLWTESDSYGYLFFINGSADNDVFACGKLGTILHYNGSTWHWYKDYYMPYMWFYSVAVKDDLIVLVGVSPEGKAVIVRGHRMND